jgi:hypothetical protein
MGGSDQILVLSISSEKQVRALGILQNRPSSVKNNILRRQKGFS